MKKRQILIFIFVLQLICQLFCIAETHDNTDFEGTWHNHELASGDRPEQRPCWTRRKLTIGSDGSAAYTGENSLGDAGSGTYPDWIPAISADGIITRPNDPVSEYHGVMSDDKKLFVHTESSQPADTPKLAIYIKRTAGDIFSQSDLEGTWYNHELASGDRPEQRPCWTRRKLIIGSDGSAAYTGENSLGDAGSGTYPNWMPTISADGIITRPNDPSSEFLGVMSDDKKLFVHTETSQPTDAPKLAVYIKRKAGVIFSGSDLTGTWYGHELVAGDRPDQEPGWAHRTLVIDDTGSCTYSGTNQNGQVSSGTMDLPFNISMEGVVTNLSEPTADLKGVLNDNKNIMVITQMEQPKNQPMIAIYIKKDTSMEKDDFEGTWHNHELASGDRPEQRPCWTRRKLTIGSDGSAAYTGENSLGDAGSGTYPDWIPAISADGIITRPNDPVSEYHGVMSDDKKLFVHTESSQPADTPKLAIYIKRTARDIFSQSDLEGTWYNHELASGDRPEQRPCWTRRKLIIGSDGSAAYTGENSLGDAGSGTYPNWMPTISADGIITRPNDPSSEFLGVMSDDKKLFVHTETSQPTDAPKLAVYIKRKAGVIFSGSDLTGTWYGHELVAGDRPDQEPGWAHRTLVIDDTGSCTYSGTNQNGQVSSGTMEMPFDISAEGIISNPSEPAADFKGAMNDSKSMMVITQTEQPNNQPVIAIYIKRGNSLNENIDHLNAGGATISAMVESGSIDIEEAVVPESPELDFVSPPLDFTIYAGSPGETVVLSVLFADQIPDSAKWYKYTTHQGWIDFSSNVTFSQDRYQAFVTLTDGGTGDDDGIANSIIVDPSVLATQKNTPSQNDASGGGGGGCFISAVMVY